MFWFGLVHCQQELRHDSCMKELHWPLAAEQSDWVPSPKGHSVGSRPHDNDGVILDSFQIWLTLKDFPRIKVPMASQLNCPRRWNIWVYCINRSLNDRCKGKDVKLPRINSGLCSLLSQCLYGWDKFTEVTIKSVYRFLLTEKDGYNGCIWITGGWGKLLNLRMMSIKVSVGK